MIKELEINDEIRDKEIRLIDNDGSQLGIVNVNEALQIANNKKLDLVKIAPQANPPVCKILDYGKYKYEQAKKEKEAKKKQKVISIKEIRLSPKIETHDLNIKANNANKFLKNGDKVKVTLRFRGREMGYVKIGYKVMEKFASITEEFSIIEKRAKLEGRNMVMILAPKNE